MRPATWLERGVFIAAALLLINPGVVTDVVGLLLLALALAVQKLRPATLSAPEGVRREPTP